MSTISPYLEKLFKEGWGEGGTTKNHSRNRLMVTYPKHSANEGSEHQTSDLYIRRLPKNYLTSIFTLTSPEISTGAEVSEIVHYTSLWLIASSLRRLRLLFITIVYVLPFVHITSTEISRHDVEEGSRSANFESV